MHPTNSIDELLSQQINQEKEDLHKSDDTIESSDTARDEIYGVFSSFYSTKDTQIGNPYFSKEKAQEYADRLNKLLPHAYHVKPIKTVDSL